MMFYFTRKSPPNKISIFYPAQLSLYLSPKSKFKYSLHSGVTCDIRQQKEVGKYCTENPFGFN